MKTVCMLLTVLLLASSVYAGCRVRKGDTKQEVIKKCGTPEFSETIDTFRYGPYETRTDAWYYEGKTVIFKANKVVKVKH